MSEEDGMEIESLQAIGELENLKDTVRKIVWGKADSDSKIAVLKDLFPQEKLEMPHEFVGNGGEDEN